MTSQLARPASGSRMFTILNPGNVMARACISVLYADPDEPIAMTIYVSSP